MVNPYLEGNFAPVLEERTDDRELEVTGVIPPDLEGRLLRNGPNPVSTPADPSDYHWFSGDGMIHAVSLAGGKATGYRNRWVRTRALAGKVATAEPKGPRESIDGPANTHVIRHAGTTLALVESGFPHALSPDLDRARVHDFDSTLSSPMTAHPKLDPATGELDAGLFFICFQKDPGAQFVPIQRRLASQDALSTYLVHTGSGVFACPPGTAPGRPWGHGLV